MTRKELEKFIKFLQKKGWICFGPVEINGEILIKEIDNPKKIILNGCLTRASFKEFFIPSSEKLFTYQKGKLRPSKDNLKRAVFGLTVFDLKALNLYLHIFEKDAYFQKRFKNTLVIGQSLVVRDGLSALLWLEKYEEDILEHLPFDIFLGFPSPKLVYPIAKTRPQLFGIYTGSRAGQKVLDEFAYKDYEHIQFAGPIKEEGLDSEMKEIREKFYQAPQKMWQDLAKRCIQCGKCTLVCPTCFCFDKQDVPSLPPDSGERVRCWSSCFYNQFSEISGRTKFLDSTAKRIHYWYEHKFVRIPDEYSFRGCVGCGRCSQVCPAGIDIKKVLKRIKNSTQREWIRRHQKASES